MLKRFAGIILLLSGLCLVSYAQNSTAVVERTFNKTEIENVVQLKKYQYEIPPKAPMGIWERLMWYVKRWFNRVFEQGASNTTVRYIVIIIVIFIAVMQLLKANFGSIIGRNTQHVGAVSYLKNQNPFVIDYDKQLQEAEKQQNYREAVRLWQLKTIKTLHTIGLIQWKNHKTNMDFSRELTNNPNQTAFKKLTRYFEYVWYGEFPLVPEQYLEINQHYKEFINQVNQGQNHE